MLKGEDLAGQTHETFEQREELKSSSDRSFGLVFVVVFLLIGVWPWLFGTSTIRLWSFIAAGVMLTAAMAVPVILSPANRLWSRFGLLLHRIMNPVVMGLIFFLAVTPTALIMRALGKDPLRRRLDAAASTYWIDREPPGPAPESMTDQF
jgi:hypothetical protein